MGICCQAPDLQGISAIHRTLRISASQEANRGCAWESLKASPEAKGQVLESRQCWRAGWWINLDLPSMCDYQFKAFTDHGGQTAGEKVGSVLRGSAHFTKKAPKRVSFSFIRQRFNGRWQWPQPVPGSSCREVNKINQCLQVHKGKVAFFPAHTTKKAAVFPALTHALPWKPCTTLRPLSWQAGKPHGSVHCQKHPSELGVSFNSQDCSGNTPATVLFPNSRGRLHTSNRK